MKTNNDNWVNLIYKTYPYCWNGKPIPAAKRKHKNTGLSQFNLKETPFAKHYIRLCKTL